MTRKEINAIAIPTWCPVPGKTEYIALGSIAGVLDSDFSSTAHLEIYSMNLSSKAHQSSNNSNNNNNNNSTTVIDHAETTNSSSTAMVSESTNNNGGFFDNVDTGSFSLGPKVESNSSLFTSSAASISSTSSNMNSSSNLNNGPIKLGRVDSSDRFNRLSWSNSLGSAFSTGLIASASNNGVINCWNPEAIMNGNSDEALVAKLIKHTSAVRGLEFNPLAPNLLASGGDDGSLVVWNLQNPSSPVYSVVADKDTQYIDPVSNLQWNRLVPKIVAATSYNGVTSIWDMKDRKFLLSFANKENRNRISSVAWNPSVVTQLAVASEDDKSPVIQIWDLRQAHDPVRELRGHTKGILSLSWCPDDENFLVSCGKDNRTICWNPNNGEVHCEFPVSHSWTFDVQWSRNLSVFSTASFDSKVTAHSIQESTEDVPQRDLGDFGQHLGLNQTPQKQTRHFTTAPKWMRCPVGAQFGFGGKFVNFSNLNDQRKVTIHSLTTNPELVNRVHQFDQAVTEGNIAAICESKLQNSDGIDKDAWNITRMLLESDWKARVLSYLGYDYGSISTEINQITSQEETLFSSNSNSSSRSSPINDSTDGLIRKALMVGNIEAAVSCCLHAGRMDEALILAACGGPELWNRTRDAYFQKQSNNPFMKTVSSIVKNQLQDIVDQADLENWKEPLAVLCTYATNDFGQLCDSLAHRLINEKNNFEGALVCNMISGNIEKTIEIWLNCTDFSSLQVLQEFIEKVTVFQKVLNKFSTNPSLANKYAEYADLLASQGQMNIAVKYLNMLPSTPKIKVLLDRVYNAQLHPEGNIPLPEFPFERVDVGRRGAQSNVQQKPPQQQGPTKQVPQTQTQPKQQPQTQPQQQPLQPPKTTNQQAPSNFGAFGLPPVPEVPQNQPQNQQFNQPQRPNPQPQTQNPMPQPNPNPNPQPAFFKQPTTNVNPSPAPSTTTTTTTATTSSPASLAKKPAAKAQGPVDPATVDVSKVPENQMVIVQALLYVYGRVFQGNLSAADTKKKETVALSLQILFEKLNAGEINADLGQQLAIFADALARNDFPTADNTALEITQKYWDSASVYFKNMKVLAIHAKQHSPY